MERSRSGTALVENGAALRRRKWFHVGHTQPGRPPGDDFDILKHFHQSFVALGVSSCCSPLRPVQIRLNSETLGTGTRPPGTSYIPIIMTSRRGSKPHNNRGSKGEETRLPHHCAEKKKCTRRLVTCTRRSMEIRAFSRLSGPVWIIPEMLHGLFLRRTSYGQPSGCKHGRTTRSWKIRSRMIDI